MDPALLGACEPRSMGGQVGRRAFETSSASLARIVGCTETEQKGDQTTWSGSLSRRSTLLG